MDTIESLRTLDSIVLAAERFDAELTKIRAGIDQLVTRAKRGEDIASDFLRLSAQAVNATGCAKRTVSFAHAYLDETKAASTASSHSGKN